MLSLLVALLIDRSSLPVLLCACGQGGAGGGPAARSMAQDGHHGLVNAVCFTPDSQNVVTASEDATVGESLIRNKPLGMTRDDEAGSALQRNVGVDIQASV